MFKFKLALAVVALVSLGLMGCQFVLTPPSSEALGDNIYRVSWGPGPAVGNMLIPGILWHCSPRGNVQKL